MVTYTIADECDNSFTKTATLTIIDDTAPELANIPADITAECDEVPAEPTDITATDACDNNVTVDFDEARTDGICQDAYTLVRTWTATDECGNSTQAQQVITIQDSTDPVLANVPADITAECDDIPAEATDVTATDNCDDNVEIEFVEERTNGDCEDSYTLTRTYTATDNCGNTTQAVQTITVIDSTDPVLANVPADETVECTDIPAEATNVTATDNCDDNVDVEFAEERTDGDCSDSYTLIRTWTATDNCGNTTLGIQTIIVQDNTDPVLANIPADVTAECDAIPAEATNITATDNCDDNVDIDFTEERANGSCEDEYTLTRTWTATDNCGNSTQGIQVITIQDSTIPVFDNIPTDMQVACDEVMPDVPNVTATDNCDADVNIRFTEEIQQGDCRENFDLIRTWTATDNCGNSTSIMQVISVGDANPPSLDGIPADVTVECSEIPEVAEVSTSDECDNDIEVDFTEERTDGDCPDSYTLVRTWVAQDNCGNTASSQQTITVIDATDPEFTNVPADETVECDAIPAEPMDVAATDNCDDNVEIEFNEVRNDGDCEDNYTLSLIHI